MKVRIIAGDLGGRRLDTPTRKSTHVMGDRIRMAIFNTIDCDGKDILDAFAGSGALGIESLSRGAKSATFIEKDRDAYDIIVKNTTELGVFEKSKIIKAGVGGWLETTGVKQEKFDIIFADPPYNNPQLSTVKNLTKILKPQGLMLLSIPGRMCVPTVEGVVVVDKREYGEARIVFYQKSGE